MTWTLSTVPEQGGLASVTLRNPELGLVWPHDRKQSRILSAAGQVHVQDLGIEDRFLELPWRNLNQTEWSGLLKVLRAAGWSARVMKLVVSGTAIFQVPLSNGFGTIVYKRLDCLIRPERDSLLSCLWLGNAVRTCLAWTLKFTGSGPHSSLSFAFAFERWRIGRINSVLSFLAKGI